MKLRAKIEIAQRQPVRVSYLRYAGPPGEALARFWRTQVAPWLADHGLMDCPRYGVSVDNPNATPSDSCRYHACVELPAGLTLPDAPEAVIPGGRYAITHFTGTAAEIGAAWAAFIGAALADPANRIDARRQPHEHYPRGARYDTIAGVFTCELCLPLAEEAS